jgi:hypothetical protein
MKDLQQRIEPWREIRNENKSNKLRYECPIEGVSAT